MYTDDVAQFLGRFAPFDGLAPEELAALAGSVEERAYEAGEVILLEDGAPAEHLFVVREGSVELLHQGQVVDLIGSGESFGHPSLLSGLAPAFTVQVRERVRCYLIPREQAVAVLGRPSGVGFLATTLRHRLVQTGHVVHALPELATIRVSELIGRPPVFADVNATIRHAAEVMNANRSSAVLVRDGDNLSIVTDAILRERVVGGDVRVENPVSRVVEPAVQVGPDRIAVDAVVEMLDAGADHLVVVDAAREVLGVLSATDLAGLETRSPFALRHAILTAHSEDELQAATRRLGQLFLTLLDSGISALDICRVLSLQIDSVTTRLIELSVARHGPAPVAWAWLALGSTARREFTLGSDIENALAYDRSDPEVDAYFARLGEDVSRGLEACGLHLDPNDVVAGNGLWRMSAERWVEVFRDCLESPDRSHLIRANIAFDFRQIAGGLTVTPSLVAVLREAKRHPDLIRRIARSATDFKPPLGFRGALIVGSSGDARGVDLKKGGAIPITNLARFYALSNGITISSTIDRLVAVEEAGALDGETAEALKEAFQIVMRLRLDHHAAQIAEGREPDNLVDPDDLRPLTRTQLREVFRAIVHVQKKLSVYVPLGL
ncbi:MAG: cyclic nucleotide-binding domain-containing protein [Thermoleophilia bacterium]|nr:cyclic nucleotide-binding domain-containing protein [Thermoleophilia bacterium]